MKIDNGHVGYVRLVPLTCNSVLDGVLASRYLLDGRFDTISNCINKNDHL